MKSLIELLLTLTIIIATSGETLLESDVVVESLEERPTVVDLQPTHVQYGSTECVTVKMANFPETPETYVCEFQIISTVHYIKAKLQENGTVVCQTPKIDHLPPFSDDQRIGPLPDSIISKLLVRSLSGADIVSTNLTFYNCPSYETCTECVSSPYPCHFCLTGQKCTHTTDYCHKEAIIDNKSSSKISNGKGGPDFCPKIRPTNSVSEILLPSGTSKRFSIKTENLKPFVIHSRFACGFKMGKRVESVKAQLLGDTIYCEVMQFNLEGNSSELVVPVSAWYGGNSILDNPDNLHILLYSCNKLANDCETCLNLPGKYNCGICQGSNVSCTSQDVCATAISRSKESCPKPPLPPPTFLVLSKKDLVISNLEPKSGVVSGGTELSIYGMNLDTGETAKVLVGDGECMIIRRQYDRLDCLTPPSAIQGYVTVKIEIDSQKSKLTFRYERNPTIESLVDNFWENAAPNGIPSGGLRNVFRGTNFHYLNSTTFYVTYKDQKYPSECGVKSETELDCGSPNITEISANEIDAISPLTLDYGFVTDGVRLVNLLYNKSESSKYLMFPDPSFEKFESKDSLKLFVADYLTINGKDLTPAIKDTDVKIKIGTSDCVLTSMSKSQLTCRPEFDSDFSTSLSSVTVQVGSALNFTIGKLARVRDYTSTTC